MIVCQTALTRKLSAAKAELDALTKFNSPLTSGHRAGTSRTAKELQRNLESSMVSIDKVQIELIMIVDPGAGDGFQAKILVTQFHNQVESAVRAIWGNAAADPVEQLSSLSRAYSSSSVNSGISKVSYL